jgi:hypothetical protein
MLLLLSNEKRRDLGFYCDTNRTAYSLGRATERNSWVQSVLIMYVEVQVYTEFKVLSKHTENEDLLPVVITVRNQT